MNRTLIFFTIFLLCGWPASVGAEAPKTLKVGVVMGLTGGAAFQAHAVKQGLDLAVEQLRAEGWNVDIAFEDDQTNAARTVSAVQSLLAQDYKFLIGPLWSFQLNAVRPILDKSDALALIPTSSSDINGGSSPNIFNFCPRRLDQDKVIEDWSRANGIRTALIFTPIGDWGQIHRKAVRKGINAAGGEIIAAEEFNYGEDQTTLRSMLLKYREAGADVLFVTGAPGDVANVVRAKNALQMKGKVLSTQDLPDAVDLGVLNSDELRGKAFAVALQVDPQFLKQFRKRYGEEPKLYADRGFQALHVLADAVARGDGSVEAVRSVFKCEPGSGCERPLFDELNDARDGVFRVTAVSVPPAAVASTAEPK